MIKKFEEFEPINEAFGAKETDYGKTVKWRLHDIISDVKGISEKDFKRVDHLKALIDEIFNVTPEISDSIRKHEQLRSRPQYCAEHIYQWFIKDSELEKEI